jgi:hypothetical protein
VDYIRYGLTENPYEAGVLAIEEMDRFETIYPFDDTQLEGKLSTAIAKGKLADYVVTGTSGSGRTTVARHIMAAYGELWSKNGKVAYYERPHDGNVDARQVAKDVLKGLSDEVRRLGAEFKDGPCKELRDEMKELAPDYSIQDLQSLARDFTESVNKRNGAVACSVENVPNAAVFAGMRGMFEKSQGLLVCTVLAEQREAVLGALKAHEIGEEITLDKLADDRACYLATKRWERWKATPPLPFNLTGLRNVFHDKPRTVGKSLKTLAHMIDSKLINYPGNTLHPADRGLSFNEKQIRENFEQFDKGHR